MRRRLQVDCKKVSYDKQCQTCADTVGITNMDGDDCDPDGTLGTSPGICDAGSCTVGPGAAARSVLWPPAHSHC